MNAGPNNQNELKNTTAPTAATPADLRVGLVQTPIESLKKLASSTASPDGAGKSIAQTWQRPQTWNTTDLGSRIGGDVLAASAAGGIVAPLITIIDRAIMENVSNRSTLLTSARTSMFNLLTKPHHFLTSRPFSLVFLLYTTTYLAANTIDTLSSTLSPPRPQPPTSTSTPASTMTDPDPRAPTTTTAGTPKFLATSTANLTLCIYKDSQFARLFGTATSSAGPVPFASLKLFALRDALTIFASFNLPPLIAPRLAPYFKTEWEAHVSRASAAQFLAPAAVQVFSTPLHLWGLDLYNRPSGGGEGAGGGKVGWRGRIAKVKKDFWGSCGARVCRILPAFGVGGVVNMRVRRWWMEGLSGGG